MTDERDFEVYRTYCRQISAQSLQREISVMRERASQRDGWEDYSWRFSIAMDVANERGVDY